MKIDLKAFKATGRKVVCLTAYDYPTARLLDEAGIDLILVGDSLGMVVLGHEDTTQVTTEDIARHAAAVVRGVKRAMVVADLPKNTFLTPEAAVTTARTLMATGVDAVKMEGGADRAPLVAAVVAEGIPVIGHIGMLPQQVREEGGYKIKGRTPEQAEALKQDALAMEQAGVDAIVLELVTPPVSRAISELIDVPTIGIGSGDGCDGQIRVVHDVIGAFPWFCPKFVTPKADVAGSILAAAREYRNDILGAESVAPGELPK